MYQHKRIERLNSKKPPKKSANVSRNSRSGLYCCISDFCSSIHSHYYSLILDMLAAQDRAVKSKQDSLKWIVQREDFLKELVFRYRDDWFCTSNWYSIWNGLRNVWTVHVYHNSSMRSLQPGVIYIGPYHLTMHEVHPQHPHAIFRSIDHLASCKPIDQQCLEGGYSSISVRIKRLSSTATT